MAAGAGAAAGCCLVAGVLDVEAVSVVLFPPLAPLITATRTKTAATQTHHFLYQAFFGLVLLASLPPIIISFFAPFGAVSEAEA